MTIKAVLIPAIALLAGSLSTNAQTSRWPDIEKCELSAASGQLNVSALCGSLTVPENRLEPEGRQIELAWAVVVARTGNPAPDPVFFLAGGPGQSARDAAPIMQNALRDINRTRDLIYLDQRGTGGSNPLECEFDEEALLTEPDLSEINQLLRQCHEDLQTRADVRHYTTADGADDLEALRRHLGIDRINLVGGSYGTRMAQVYLRRYPDAVRSVILDGVVPTRLKLGAEHAEKLDQSLGKLFDACAGDAACASRFPDLLTAFEQLKSRYSHSLQRVQITHPRTGVGESIEFNDAVLASSLRMLAYDPSSQMMIPYLVHEAATTGSPGRLAAQALISNEQLNDAIALGLNFSVGCSEDWPYWPDDADASGTLLGNSFTELYGMVCDWWPADPVGPDFHQPFESSAPILLLSGELDPVTPPEYGEEANRQYANSTHLVARGRGHIVMTNPCIRTIATQFVSEASTAELDTDCMDTIGPEPFFLNLLGPSP
ncbi:MAG: alpha/beta fold hydrolase [Wenzhouxiangellaceae bacterium]|nr:alpha/beta fold hydrolase [Wenzhouxiangellaceae bacterium]